MNELFGKIGSGRTLSQIIFEEIRELIIKKELKPGEKLPTETELCEMFGVSRTAVREGLQLLSASGLIQIKKGSGIYINEYSSRNVTDALNLFLEINFEKKYALHVVRVRQIIEPHNAKLAALNRTDEDLTALRENFDRLKIEPNLIEQSRVDREFHLKIAKAAGNPIIPLLMEPLFQLMVKIQSEIYECVERARSAALSGHEAILKYIEQKEPSGAFYAMVEHLESAEQDCVALLKVIDSKEKSG